MQRDLDGFWRRLGVDDFQADHAGFAVFGDAVVEGRVGDGGLEDGVAVIPAEHPDGMATGRAIDVEGVIADQVRTPLARAGVDVDEKRGVTLHDDEIGMAFHGGHPGGVGQRGFQGWRGRQLARRRFPWLGVFVGGPFSDEDFGAVAIVFVPARRGMPIEVSGGGIVMFVDDVRLAAVNHLAGRVLGSDGGDAFEVRVFRFDGVVELGKTAVVASRFVKPIFVADLHVGKFEGGGMAVFGALSAPLGPGVAGDVFDFVERILHVRLEGGAGVDVGVLQVVTGIDGEDRLHLEVFAPVEEFEQPEAIAGAVAPATGVAGAPGERADGLLPIETGFEGVAFDVIAAGKTEEGWLHAGQHLHDVNTIAVGPVVKRRRKEGDQIEPHRARLVDGEDEPRFGGGRDAACFQCDGVQLPPGAEARNFDLGERGRAVVAFDGNLDWAFETRGGARVKRGAIFRMRLDRDAPITVVRNARPARLRSGGRVQAQAVGEDVIERRGVIQSDGCRRARSLHHRPVDRRPGVVQEGAVLDQFGVQAAIVGMVDFLGHQPVMKRADLPDGLVNVDNKGGAFRSGGSDRESQKDRQRR